MTRYHTTANGDIPFTPEEEAERDAEEAAAAVKIAQRVILDQITAIEETITQRRQREAILGVDSGWLAARDSEIAALRAQL